MIVLLTGERGTGKTTACRRLVELGRQRGLRPGGILAPARFDAAGVKDGITLVDVAGGEERLQGSTVRDLGGPTVGPFFMDAGVLEWGVATVARGVEAHLDLLIVDEIGPLELWRDGGFAPLLAVARQHAGLNWLLVVRPELVAELECRLAPIPAAVYTLSHACRDEAPAELAAMFWGWQGLPT